MFRWLGDEAFGLVSLLGANIGLAAIFRQIMQQSLVRELGSSYHTGDTSFRRTYAALYRLAALFAILTLFTFGLVLLLIPVFRIPPDLTTAARWFVVVEGVQTAIMIFLSPALNMFLVIERFTAYSVWFVSLRATQLVAVVGLGYVLRIEDPAQGLFLLGLAWAGMSVLTYLAGVAYLVRLDRRLMPTVRRPEPGALREVFGTFSWNSGVQVAMNFHEQIPPVLLNLLAGPLANAAWGVGFRLVAYIRMVTTGMQFGSDAVSARLAKAGDEESMHQLRRLVGIQTRLTSAVSLPAGAAVFLYAFPVLHLWVGGQVRDYQAVMPGAVLMARVLAAALAARAISDTWIIILYGAGYVRSYAPVVISGGVIAPVLGLALMKVLPADLVIIGPAVSFTAVFVGLHLMVIPFIAARCLRLSPFALFHALLGPLSATGAGVVTALAVLAAFGALQSLGFAHTPSSELGAGIRPLPLLASMVAFATTTGISMFRWGLRQEDRNRVWRIIGSVTRRSRR